MSMREARQIVQFECEKEGIEVGELWKAHRTKTISALRRTIIKRLRDETRLSWREIGALVGLNSKPNRQYLQKG